MMVVDKQKPVDHVAQFRKGVRKVQTISRTLITYDLSTPEGQGRREMSPTFTPFMLIPTFNERVRVVAD